MIKFETGKTYTHGWPGDGDLFTSWTVTKRTAQTITITDGRETKSCRILKDYSEMDGSETVKPFGSYSMCPILRARTVL